MNFIKKTKLFHLIVSNFTIAQIKAFVHIFIVPFFLFILSMNILAPFIWYVFTILLYLTVKRKTENSKAFFDILKTTVAYIMLIGVILILFVLAD